MYSVYIISGGKAAFHQKGTVVLVPGIAYKADQLPPHNAVVDNVWRYSSIPLYINTAWCLSQCKNNFTAPSFVYVNTFYFISKSNTMEKSP